MHENYDLELLMELVRQKKFRQLKEALGQMNEVDIAEILEELEVEQEILVFRLLPKDLAAEVFTYLEKIEDLISRKRYAELRDLLLPLEAQDIAGLFMELDDKVPMVFRLLPKETAAEVFTYLENTEDQEKLIGALSDRELREVLDELFLDDTVDIIEDMPANVVSRILRNTDTSTRSQINLLLNYPKDSAGSIMTTEFVYLHPDATVEQSFARIRKVGLDKETVYTCYVTQNKVLLGVVTVKRLLLSPYETKIRDIMETNVISVKTHEDKEDVAQMFSK